MKKLFFTISVLCVFTISSCVHYGEGERGNGEMITSNFRVDNFKKLEIGGAFKVILEKGEKENVNIRMDENLERYIEVENHGSTLYIGSEEFLRSDEGIEVVVTYRVLEKIDISGACKMETEGVLDGDYLTIDMGGAGALELELDVRELDLTISGAGVVELSGMAGFQHLNLQGAGGYNGFNLRSQKCEIDISGIGSAEVNVEGELVAEISGLGGVAYKGDPKSVKTNISGLGTVKEAR